MNLHIFPDDKFVDEFIQIAKAVSSQLNVFVVNSSQPLHYVKSKDVRVGPYGSQEFKESIGNLLQYRRVYIHYLTQDMCDFVNAYPHSDTIFLWVFWGGDLYTNVNYDVLDEATKAYTKVHTNTKKTNLLGALSLRRSTQKSLLARQKAIQRFSYFLHFDEQEYNLVKKYFRCKARFHYFSYPNMLQLEFLDAPADPLWIASLEEKTNLDLNKKLVLLGNSGWETSNHLSVLQKLSKVNSGNVQIVVPLSYGNPVYINHVIAEGYRLLGKCFVPITDFFPPQTYGYLLQKTDAGIFNSWRTQGVGNIVALLYLGKQLYISHRATYLGFLRRKGFAVKSVNDYYKNGLTLLSEYDAQQNRRLIVDMYSNQACQNIVGDILTLY